MAVRLLSSYAGQAVGTIYIGTDEGVLLATDQADGRIELATNYDSYRNTLPRTSIDNSNFPTRLTAVTTVPTEVYRLYRSTARGITPIKTVAAGTLTYTQGATDGASTVNTGATNPQVLTAASIAPNDPRIQITGGVATLRSGGAFYTLGGVTFPVLASGWRSSAHGQAIRFVTNAPVFDIAMDSRGAPIMVYVTDLTTRIRGRWQAADMTTTTGRSFHKFEFGASGGGTSSPRLVELYLDTATANGGLQYLTQINVTAGYDLFAVPQADECVVGYEGDSWAQGTGNGNTNGVKLTVTDFMAERLGVANPRVSGVGGTAFDYNGGTNNTFLQRLQAGDHDASRVGAYDVFVIPDSVNSVTQFNAGTPGFTPASHQTAAAAVYAAARTAQPNAIIYSCSAQTASATGFNQAFSDAAKAGMASLNDSNMIFVDSGPNGENWVPSGVMGQWYTGSNNHLNDVGMVGYGYRMADSIVNAVRAKYGL